MVSEPETPCTEFEKKRKRKKNKKIKGLIWSYCRASGWVGPISRDGSRSSQLKVSSPVSCPFPL